MLRRFSFLFFLLPPIAGHTQGNDVFDANYARQQCVGSTREVSQCIQEEVKKADRLLKTIIASYKRAVQQKEGDEFYDIAPQKLVQLLSETETKLHDYREHMSSVNYYSVFPGSIRRIRAPSIEHNITVEHIRRLLESCDNHTNYKDIHEFDLTRTDWCETE